MPQLHFYLPDEVVRRIRQRAAASGQSVSRFVAEIVRKELGEDWPQ
ncbi:MAG: ribbon-helix-helix protein, CopG family, partial [Deltaproteobacteria bacterium]|nr:ribbon-helix-helix protein, CopG family [Deltaproteobacteria bacterium]